VSTATPGVRSVAVVTDSTTYLPDGLIEASEIQRVSLYVGWDRDLRPEHEYRDLGDFYRQLQEHPEPPTTSQPSVGDFVACYEPLVAAGRDVASIHIAEGLSGTCASAREAARALEREGHPGRVAVVDGETGAGGLGLLVLAASASAARGETLEEVAAAAREARRRRDIWFCQDTLEYLRRGGRIGAAQALLGSPLSIKPILTFGTEIAPVARVRTRRRALERMVAYLRELERRGAKEWIVQHAQAAEDAEYLVSEGTEILGVPPLFCTQVGPVLGAHLGRGMLVGGLSG
jgi:DegV family protein with EDD domain